MPEITKRNAALALLLLAPAASLGVWAAVFAFPGAPLGKGLFAFFKLWLIGLPLLWHVFVDHRRPAIPRPHRKGMAAGVVSGVLIFLAIGAGYLLFGHWIDRQVVSDKALEVGLTDPLRYGLGALYWCTFNSLMEEYIWRWFVFTRCERLMPRLLAVIVSGLLFTAHHVIALAAYFDWRVTLLGSLGVFVGGATWSWIYLRYRNLYAAYISHVFADVVIFLIGYELIFGL